MFINGTKLEIKKSDNIAEIVGCFPAGQGMYLENTYKIAYEGGILTLPESLLLTVFQTIQIIPEVKHESIISKVIKQVKPDKSKVKKHNK